MPTAANDNPGEVQAELGLTTGCPICGSELQNLGFTERLCALDLIRWNGSAERLEALDARGEEQADAMPAAIAKFVARRMAEMAGLKVKAAKKAEADQEAKLEAEIQEEVIAALTKLRKQRRLYFWRANSGGWWAGEAFVRANKSGCPDIVCSVRIERPRAAGGTVTFGAFLGIELKRPGEKQNPNQLRFETDLRDQGGGYYAVCTSAAEAVAAVERVSRLERP